MKKIITKITILLGMICIITPFNFFMPVEFGFQDMKITYYIPLVIGYVLLFLNFRHYTKRQKIFLIISFIICLINVSTEPISNYLDERHERLRETCDDEFSDDFGFYMLDTLTFFVTYFGLRIFCFFAGKNVLIDKEEPDDK